MGLGWKTAAVAAMGLLLLVLTIKARRSNYEKFQARYSRRKYRVPVDAGAPVDQEEDSTQGPS